MLTCKHQSNYGYLYRFAPSYLIATCCSTLCMTFAALTICNMTTRRHPSFHQPFDRDLIKVHSSCVNKYFDWQLMTRVAFVCGLNLILHRANLRRPCISCYGFYFTCIYTSPIMSRLGKVFGVSSD